MENVLDLSMKIRPPVLTLMSFPTIRPEEMDRELEPYVFQVFYILLMLLYLIRWMFGGFGFVAFVGGREASRLLRRSLFLTPLFLSDEYCLEF